MQSELAGSLESSSVLTLWLAKAEHLHNRLENNISADAVKASLCHFRTKKVSRLALVLRMVALRCVSSVAGLISHARLPWPSRRTRLP